MASSDAPLRPVAAPTSFVGRSRELAQLAELFETARMVTVAGPPGAGKSRLAREHARRVEATSTTGASVWFVELGDARGEGDVRAAVARTLGVATGLEPAPGEAADPVTRAIAARGPALLVLDGFEHLVSCAPAVLLPWLQAAPELAVLVTSRERLGVPGETVSSLGPLALPRAGGDPATSEAVSLFLARARAAGRPIESVPDELATVAELVRRLDGLPLAIELAAARASILGPKQLLERLSAGIDLLADPRDRRVGLRATLEWSWRLLPSHEQAALAQLSVFPSSFDVEAAEAVVSLSAFGEAPPSLDVVQSLVDKSLLSPGQASELPGETRFVMLSTVRTFALEKLPAREEPEATRARLAAHFAARAATWAAGVERHDGPACLRRLAVELPNLAHVVRWGSSPLDAAARSDVSAARSVAKLDAALEVVLALEHVFYMRGPTSQCLELVDCVLGAAGIDAAAKRLRALAHKARGRALRDAGRLDEAGRELDKALILAREAGEPAIEGRVLGHVGFSRQASGDAAGALPLFREGLERVRAGGDRRSEGMLVAATAQALGALGRGDESAATFEEALAIHREVGNLYSAAFAIASRAERSRAAGRPEAARLDLEQGLAIYREFGERRHEGIALVDLGVLHQDERRFGEARAALDQALACFREHGSRLLEGLALGQIGDLDREEGRLEVARSAYHDATAIARDALDRVAEARWLVSRASVEAALGRADAARALLEEGSRALVSTGEASWTELADLHAGLCAAAAGDEPAARRALDAAIARSPAVVERPAWVRLAVRLLERALGRAPAPPPPRPSSPAGARGPIAISASGRWFKTPTTDTVSLQRRHALRLILKALADRREAEPGAALTQSAVLDAGWPGERVLPQAGALRVYNALSTLRKLGLRDVLLTRDDGYLLDPAVELVRGED